MVTRKLSMLLVVFFCFSCSKVSAIQKLSLSEDRGDLKKIKVKENQNGNTKGVATIKGLCCTI